MAGEVAAKRHARAVFEIASEESSFERWRADLDLMAEVFSDPDLAITLEDPRIRFEDKASAVGQGLPDASPLALNLAKLLIQRRQVKIMSLIAEEFGILMDRLQGTEHAEVITASPIDEQTEESFRQHLAQVTGSEILLKTKVDPDIIGGFIARVGDKVIDGSVRNRLQHHFSVLGVQPQMLVSVMMC